MKAKLFIPPIIERVLEAKATLAISVSGGADSEALTRALVAVWRERGWPGKVFLVHANLGRAEWPETLPHVERIGRDAGLGLEVVRRAQGDLVAQWQERQRQLVGTGTPFWSSSGQRYCTSGQKRDQINRVLRRFSLVISAEGIRAEESTERSEKQPLMVREKITAERLKHLTPEEAWTEWQASHQAGLWQDSDWGELIGDNALMMAIIDRLLHHGEVFYVRGSSYRMRGKELVTLTAKPESGAVTSNGTV